MNRLNLHHDMVDALANVVLRRVETRIKSLRPDISALAPEHIPGYEGGFKAAKRAMLDLLGEIGDPI